MPATILRSKLGRKVSKSYEDIHYTCTIRFLDDSEPITVTYRKNSPGQWLIEYVCKELNLIEKDYFGLRYVDAEKQRHWLDPVKTVYRQLKHVNPTVLCFRVKFYPADPLKLKEEITRYFLFLQLRRDLHHGRLLCSPQDANMLAAFIIQSEVGDFDPQDHVPGYVAQFKMLPKQTLKQEEKIGELHKTFSGDVPSEAEANFLTKSCSLDTYGVDPHPVKDQKGNQMYLGVTHLGIVTFQGNKRTHLFKWPQISKIAFEGKMFIVHVTVTEKKHACGFKCPTFSACKHLWKCAVQQQYFFTLSRSSEAPKVTSGGGWFTRGSKFRFSGRCQNEVYADSANINREPPAFVRSASNPQLVRQYNSLRSTYTLPSTLPRSGRDREHMSEGDLGAHGVTGNCTVAIPEEAAVVVSVANYEPLASPSEERLPPLPGQETEVGNQSPSIESSDATSECFGSDDVMTETFEGCDVAEAPLDGCDVTSSLPACDDVTDLDSQILELQTELEKCKALNEMTDFLGSDLSEPATTPDDDDNDYCLVSAEDEEAADTWPSPIMLAAHALAVALVLFLAAMLLLALLVLEGAQLPLIGTLGRLPEVDHFREHHYRPWRQRFVWS